MALPIVYAYPECSWEKDMTPSRQRYLTEALSAYTRVFFLSYGRSAQLPPGSLRPAAERVSDTLTVIQGAFGLRRTRLGRRLGRPAAALDARWLHALLARCGVEDYIYWLSAPAPSLTWGMRLEHLVYDCIDPCLQEGRQADYDRTEFALARRAQTVFCTAETLLTRMRLINPASYLLPNACSRATLQGGGAMLRGDGASLPEPLRGRPRPIVGYMGTFDRRVDVELLVTAARQLPDYTFALAGRVNPDQEARVSALRALPNVVVPGAVSVQDGHAYTAACDVGIIPFLPGAVGDAINPVKMYMYLGAGKPVVTTWLREPARHAPLVSATRSPAEFVEAIRRAATEDDAGRAAARVEFARRNTWDHRARAALEILEAPDRAELPAGSRKVRIAL